MLGLRLRERWDEDVERVPRRVFVWSIYCSFFPLLIYVRRSFVMYIYVQAILLSSCQGSDRFPIRRDAPRCFTDLVESSPILYFFLYVFASDPFADPSPLLPALIEQKSLIKRGRLGADAVPVSTQAQLLLPTTSLSLLPLPSFLAGVAHQSYSSKCLSSILFHPLDQALLPPPQPLCSTLKFFPRPQLLPSPRPLSHLVGNQRIFSTQIRAYPYLLRCRSRRF